MTTAARLTVIEGPDRGQSIELSEEMTSIGFGKDNDLHLTDEEVEDLHFNIGKKNGLHLLYVPKRDDVQLDGKVVPVTKWVRLPASGLIRLTTKTRLMFSVSEPSTTQEKKSTESISVTKSGKKAAARTKTKRGSPATYARFITDQAEDPLVKLGEDGHYPELVLQEGRMLAKADRNESQSNPLLLIGIFSFSTLLSMAMLFLDTEGGTDTRAIEAARRAIVAYYGDDRSLLEPYQVALRTARQAYVQGNTPLERDRYQFVLRLLREENRSRIRPLAILDEKGLEVLRKLGSAETRALGSDFTELSSDDKLTRLISLLLQGK